jgi:hypothetical protein
MLDVFANVKFYEFADEKTRSASVLYVVRARMLRRRPPMRV